MDDMPIMEPLGGDWVDMCVAAAWMVLNAPVRLASCVFAQSWGVMLYAASACIHVYLIYFSLRVEVEHALEKLFELAYPCIAHDDIQPSPSLHHLGHQLLPRLGIAHVAGHLGEPLLCLLLTAEYARCLFEKRLELLRRFRVAEVVNRDIGAVREVGKCDGASNARYAACYGCRFAVEELCRI